MFVLDRLLVSGLHFVLDKLALAVDQEINDEQRVRERLLETQMRVELGEISAEEAAAVEQDLVERLRAIRARDQEQAGSGELRITGAEASLTGEFHEPVERPAPALARRRERRRKSRGKPHPGSP